MCTCVMHLCSVGYFLVCVSVCVRALWGLACAPQRCGRGAGRTQQHGCSGDTRAA